MGKLRDHAARPREATLRSNSSDRPVFVSELDPILEDYDNRLTNSENYEWKITYYWLVNTAAGTLTIPEGASIVLGQFPKGINSLVSKVENGEPTGELPETAGLDKITISTFDISGNYSLTDTPSNYPVAIIGILNVPQKYLNNLDNDKIITSSLSNSQIKEDVVEILTPARITKCFIGKASEGAADTDSVWTISIIEVAADGTSVRTVFNNVKWSDRLIL